MRRLDWRLLLFVGCLVLGFTPDASAQEVTATSRSAGMAEALTAGASGTAALQHNPAGISSAIMYSAEAGYAYNGRGDVHAAQAHLVDTKSNPYFGAGLSFTYENGTPKDAPSHEGFHVRGGIAVPLLDGMVKLGTAIGYSSVNADDDEVLAALMLDAGVIVQPIEWLAIGVAGHNLVNGGYDDELPRTISTGVAVASLSWGFQVAFDLMFNLSVPKPESARLWRVGAEVLLGQSFPIRAGFLYDEVPDHKKFSVGAGFRDADSLIGVDVSYQHNFDDSRDKNFVGSLSVYF